MTEDEFNAAYQTYLPIVRSTVRGMLGVTHRADVDDLVQDVWLRVWERRHMYQTRADGPRAWLLTVARHVVIDYIRRKRAAPEAPLLDAVRACIPDPGLPLEDAVLASERSAQLRTALHDALCSLPERQRLAAGVYWRWYARSRVPKGGYEHVASALGTGVFAAKSMIVRAHAYVRSELATRYPELLER